MKNMIFFIGLFLSLQTQAQSLAGPTLPENLSATMQQRVPKEISALLLTEDFHKRLKERETIAIQSGRTLFISAYRVVRLGTEVFAGVDLETAVSADFQGPQEPAGSLEGVCQFGPLGEVYFHGVYYKPPAELPGGSSVGNL